MKELHSKEVASTKGDMEELLGKGSNLGSRGSQASQVFTFIQVLWHAYSFICLEFGDEFF